MAQFSLKRSLQSSKSSLTEGGRRRGGDRREKIIESLHKNRARVRAIHNNDQLRVRAIHNNDQLRLRAIHNNDQLRVRAIHNNDQLRRVTEMYGGYIAMIS